MIVFSRTRTIAVITTTDWELTWLHAPCIGAQLFLQTSVTTYVLPHSRMKGNGKAQACTSRNMDLKLEGINALAGAHHPSKPHDRLCAVLYLTAAEMVSAFLKSSNHNLKYVGIDALARIVRINPKYATEHQVAVIDCLEDPDQTLKAKTLELLFKMTKPSNVEVGSTQWRRSGGTWCVARAVMQKVLDHLRLLSCKLLASLPRKCFWNKMMVNLLSRAFAPRCLTLLVHLPTGDCGEDAGVPARRE